METVQDQQCDVLVVGAGNAASCAALAAQERGAKVIMLEAAPEADSGGNSRYTAGAMRVVFDGAPSLAQLMDLTDLVGRSRLIRWLRRTHAMHHTPELMQKWNFNVTVPLADVVLGTLYRGPVPAQSRR